MTPGTRAIITRGSRVEFRAQVERIAWPGGDVILTDVRRLDLVQMMAMFAWLSPATAARYLHLYGGRLEDMAKKLGGVK